MVRALHDCRGEHDGFWEWCGLSDRLSPVSLTDRIGVRPSGGGGRPRRVFVPIVWGTLKDMTGTYRTGFWLFGVVAAIAWLSTMLLRGIIAERP